MRDTTGRIRVVETDSNTKGTNVSDGRQGVIAWNASKVIYIIQIDDGAQTSVPVGVTLETVDPDYMKAYLQSMLDNGWTIKKGYELDPNIYP